MFGNNTGTTSTWGQPQQNQQTNAFGQPANTFGSGQNAFGATNTGGVFGQPQQQPAQQQPAANPMFGGFGQTQQPAQQQQGASTGFGFGNNTAGPTAFGAKPATTGFGAFGGATQQPSTFGNAFGAAAPAGQPTAPGAFGQPSTSTGGGFGTANAFAPKPATTTFGAPAVPATNPDGSTPPVTTGTSNPPYSVFTDKDPANTAVTLQYQGITCTPAYRGTSLEELRWQDYSQNRKTPSAGAATGAFGGFGAQQPAAQPTTSIFGGAAAPNPTPSFGFGATNPAANTATQPTTGFGGFGTTNTNATGGFGGFGAQNQQPQQPQQPASTGFGGFGTQNQQPQQQQQPAAGGLFGGNAFGQNTAATGTTTNAFGSTPGTNAFGQPQAQQQPAAGGGLFGQTQPATTNNAFGSFGTTGNKPAGGLFGTTQPAQTSTFGFGTQQQQNPQQQQQQPAAGGGLFGGGGIFGNAQQQQQQQQAGQTQQPAQTGGLFGSTQPTQPAAGGLFGNNAGTGLFGNAQQQQGQQQPAQTNTFSTGLFGPKPVTSTAPAAGGLFGNTQTNATPAAPTGGLFGSQPAQPTNGGLFGNSGGNLFGNAPKPAVPTFGTTPTSSQPTGSLFGSTFNTSIAPANNAAVTAPLTASVAQPIGANIPIFNLLSQGPRAVPVEQPKKKVSFFPDASTTRSPVPRLQLGYTPSSSRLRGFASSTSSPGLGSSLALSSSKSNTLALSRNGDSLSTDALFGSNSGGLVLGSGNRQSVKKLVLDRKVDSSDIFAKTGGRVLPGALKAPNSLGASSKVTFNPALSIAAREETSSLQRGEAPALMPKKTGAARFNSARGESVAPEVPPAEAAKGAEGELEEGDYYVKPSIQALKKLGYEQLTAFEGLVVGRVGRGEVRFLEPVNLTEVPRLQELMGGLIQFGEQDCVIYPDYDEADKPPPGQGINVRARIEILGAWPLDRATKEPIKDENHPQAAKHLKRLQKMRDTHFESFDFRDGKWTFTVDHF